ncbi:MAG: hypothetical protein QNK18_02650 [Gammaproteobacteria bacterium]|nr:hypothetical protein [Gammaproteobacteria bacterium]
MALIEKVRLAFRISRSEAITRRYFVTNGFDGALTILGLLMGFRVSSDVIPDVVLAAGFGTAVALGVSGLSSAYISERAERRQEFDRLRAAMGEDLRGSAHEYAVQIAPILVALVNGLSPFLIAQAILFPLWLAASGLMHTPTALDVGLATALGFVFLLGVFLGRISGSFWLWSGLRAAALAVATVSLILLFGG